MTALRWPTRASSAGEGARPTISFRCRVDGTGHVSSLPCVPDCGGVCVSPGRRRCGSVSRDGVGEPSIPCNVRHALANEPYPFASQVRFFTMRWSCSTTLFRYLHRRRRTRCGSAPSSFSASTAGGKAGCLSTLITRGTGLPGELRAFRKNRLAAAASRLAVSRKSIVWPVESTARYR